MTRKLGKRLDISVPSLVYLAQTVLQVQRTLRKAARTIFFLKRLLRHFPRPNQSSIDMYAQLRLKHVHFFFSEILLTCTRMRDRCCSILDLISPSLYVTIAHSEQSIIITDNHGV